VLHPFHRQPHIVRSASALTVLLLAACATSPASQTDSDFIACPAYKPAYDVTDRFMETFNARDQAAHEETYHFPHIRIASGNVAIIPNAGTERDTFPRLIATGWDRSAWAERRIVQCDSTKAHMLTTFIRYRADGSELSRFNSLYIVEFKSDRWAITGRSSFAP
jgi:hypothetical protein